MTKIMLNQDSSKAELLAEIDNLRNSLKKMQRENQQLQILLETTNEHSDAMEVEWQESSKKALRESESRLAQFLEAIPVGVVVLDAKGKIYFVNKRAQQLLGKELEPGLSAEKLLAVYKPYIAGTDQPYPWKKLPIVLALRGKASAIDDVEIIKNQQRISIEVWGTPIFENGAIAYAINVFQDITARRQAEMALREHQQQRLESLESKFSDMVATVPGVIYQWYERRDGERGFYYISPRCEEFYGVKPNDLLSDFKLLPIHPDDIGRWQDSLQYAVKTLTEWNFEGRFILPSGETKWWRGISKPLAINDEETIFNGIIIDITEQKALEANLLEKEAILEDAQRMALVGNWVWDIKTGTVLRSAQDCLNYAIDPNHYIPTYQAFIEPVHSEDKNIIDTKLEECIIEGKTAEFEFRIIRPDGQIRTLRSQTELEFDANGTPIRLKGFSQDITERKRVEEALRESEERLIMAIEAINDGFVYHDAEDKLVLCNSKYREIYKESANLIITGGRFEDLLRGIAKNGQYPEAIGHINEWVAERMRIHRSGETLDQPLANGHWLQITEQRTQDGGYVGLRIDITERKRAEKQLQLQNLELQQKNQELEVLTKKLEEVQRQQLYQLNKAYERFVPHEFLKLLDKTSVLEVKLGDHVEKEMTILFSDIRGFTALSETMTPTENFTFINEYLNRMVPIISQHEGVIDKYIGDAIMALFPTSPDHAVQAAIGMLKALSKYNETRGRPERPRLKIGIGLNTGYLMLGTIGDKTRMDGTVIADAVNVASRVEELTKIYNTPLLITEQTYLKLKNVLRYEIRVIDRVKVKGKSQYLTVYEVFDADNSAVVELKLQTLRDFEQGFMCFHNGNFTKAFDFFEKVLAINEDDEAARVYVSRCRSSISR
jgi:PAS domain S-box-containing protein